MADLLLWAEVVAANDLFVLHERIEFQSLLFIPEMGFDLNVPVLLQQGQEFHGLLCCTALRRSALYCESRTGHGHAHLNAFSARQHPRLGHT